jgi:hypothetical protein
MSDVYKHYSLLFLRSKEVTASYGSILPGSVGHIFNFFRTIRCIKQITEYFVISFIYLFFTYLLQGLDKCSGEMDDLCATKPHLIIA